MTSAAAAPTRTLNDGHEIPVVGLGCYQLDGEDGVTAILSALEIGYRLLDTAVNYGNEGDVGEAVRRSGLPREDVFITSKIPGRHHSYDDALASVRTSLETLRTDYLDLQLIHWPNPSVGRFHEAWRALVDLQREGLVRSIGVSNFTPAHLDRIVEETGVTPAVNQVELHPYFPQAEMRAEHERRGVVTESWSPLGKRQAPYGEAPVAAAAAAHGVEPGQVILRWQVQLGAVPIPKSATPSRQAQNIDLFGFELSDDEVAAISGLARPDGRLFGGDPEVHEEM